MTDMTEVIVKMNGKGRLVSDDYIRAIAESIADDVAADVAETADPTCWNEDDVRLAVGRVLCGRLGIER